MRFFFKTCFEKLKATKQRRVSFQRWRRNGQTEGGCVGNASSWKARKESASKESAIDKLLPLSSKQGKAGGLNHEEITLIIYIVYTVSK